MKHDVGEGKKLHVCPTREGTRVESSCRDYGKLNAQGMVHDFLCAAPGCGVADVAFGLLLTGKK